MIQMTITDTEILAIEDGKLLGKIEFILSDNKITILHTYAYESGRGIGTLLMKNAVELAKENQYTIIHLYFMHNRRLFSHNRRTIVLFFCIN